jgi:hypothetical protein
MIGRGVRHEDLRGVLGIRIEIRLRSIKQ